MKTIQNINRKMKQPIFFVSSVILLVMLCFFTILPKLTSRLYPQKRAIILNEFIRSVQQKHNLNPQEYWQFREFYSPGYFTFNRKGIEKNTTEKILNTSGVTLNDAQNKVVLKFSSSNLVSLDILTNQNTLPKAISLKNSIKNILYEDPSTKIFFQNSKTILILFILPAEEMKKANGFFDYQNEDKNITNGKYWLNITQISID